MKRNLRFLRESITLCCMALIINSSAQQTPALTDAEIAWITLSYNKIDIDYATLALLKSQQKDILGYAKSIHEQNSSSIISAEALFHDLTLDPLEHEYSKALWQHARERRQSLSNQAPADFNQAYIENEIAFQKKLLHALDQLLIPQTQDPRLRRLLSEELKPKIQQHLDRIESLSLLPKE